MSLENKYNEIYDDYKIKECNSCNDIVNNFYDIFNTDITEDEEFIENMI